MEKTLLLNPTRFLFILICLFVSAVSFGQNITLFQYDFEGSVNSSINNTAGTPSFLLSNTLGFGRVSPVNSCNTGSTVAFAANNWTTGNLFRFVVNTTGYENLVFSYCNIANDIGLGNFLVRMSTDQGATYSTVSPEYLVLSTGSTRTTAPSPFPAAANNNGEVWIEIFKTNNPTGGNGNGTNSAANRTFYIDDVTLRGCQISAGVLSGNQNLCTTGVTTTTFVSTVAGGTWSSSNPTVATVNATTGVITSGVTAGTSTITYTVGGGTTGCTPRTATRVVTVSGPSVGGTVSSNQTICFNTAPANISLSGNTGNVIRWESATNSAFTTGLSTITSVATTLTGSVIGNLTQSTYFRAVVQNSVCSIVNSSSILVTVNAAIPTPTTAAPIQPDCALATGTVPLSGLPASGTIVQTGTSSTSYTITGTSQNITGLSPGTYNFAVSIGGCTSGIVSVTINNAPNITNTWTGSWSNGVPTIDHKLVFSSNYSNTNDVDLEGCSCAVTGSAVVRIKSGRTMRIKNDVNVQSTASLTFEDTSSLVQINNAAVNTGVITYERQTTPISRFDYTYYCSPVSGQTLFALSPNTLFDKFFSFNSTTDSYRPESSGNLMGLGVGYIIRGPQNFGISSPTGTYIAPFRGVPYNGNLTTPIGPAGNSNLIGNPYASALDANLFLAANSGVLEGTIYFWTHNTSIRLASSLAAGTAGSGVLAYTSDDYAAYNRTGGVATASPAPSSASSTSGPGPVKSNAPTGQIASGQAFFGTSVAAGNAVFNNSMRVGFGGIVANSNADFFKMASTKKSSSVVEMNRIWLDLTNTEGAFKETLLGYITDATNDYESAFDGETFDGNAYVDFYSINNDKNLTIQGRALPFVEADVVPLGYKSAIAGEFAITVRDKDGLFETQKVYLEDKLLGTEFDLSKGTYNFSTQTGTFNDRFAIRYTSKTLGIEDVVAVEDGIYISNKNKQIKVSSTVKLIDKVQIYDLTGKLLYLKTSIGANEAIVSNIAAPNQVLVVKITFADGMIVTRKLIF